MSFFINEAQRKSDIALTKITEIVITFLAHSLAEIQREMILEAVAKASRLKMIFNGFEEYREMRYEHL